MKKVGRLLVSSLVGSFLYTAAISRPAVASAQDDWRQILRDRLPLFGHRNWIVIADSAYPAQSREGIETIVADAGQIDVLNEVLAGVSSSRHVRPIFYTDLELTFVKESDAPGVDQYRKQLSSLLPDRRAHSLLHEEIIHKLDEAGQTFRVLIIKTNMTIPYTSVFLQLDCSYWSAEAEQKLRASMAQRSHHPKSN